MPSMPQGPARRIAVTSALVVALLAAAVGVTIWRYEITSSKKGDAVYQRGFQLQISEAISAFWREEWSISDYVIKRAPDELRQLERAQLDFNRIIGGLTPDDEHEANLLNEALAGNKALISLFQTEIRPAARVAAPLAARRV